MFYQTLYRVRLNKMLLILFDYKNRNFIKNCLFINKYSVALFLQQLSTIIIFNCFPKPTSAYLDVLLELVELYKFILRRFQ